MRIALLALACLAACDDTTPAASAGMDTGFDALVVADMADAGGDVALEENGDGTVRLVPTDMAAPPLDMGALPDAESDADTDAIPPQPGVFVETTSGQARGIALGTLRIFRGLPYAAPPLGDRRFRRPAPVDPWPNVLEATAFGPACMQASWSPNGTSEDCLTLNVWAHRDAEPRPVIVWVHGGGFLFGEAAANVYDGTDLAVGADAVVISINYRLGVFGGLALPGLQAEDPEGAVGNLAVLDMMQALRWIRANAPAFGGDPDNITVYGQASGANAVCALMGAPAADDLFHKAMLQSGNCTRFASLEDDAALPAFAPSEALLATLQCQDALDRLACLRSLPAQTLANAALPLPFLPVLDRSTAAFGPVIDGVVLPETPYARAATDAMPPRPVLVGSTGHEAFLFTAGEWIATHLDFGNALTAFFGDPLLAGLVVASYPLAEYPNAKDAFTAFLGDYLFNCNSMHFAQAMGGYAYHLRIGPQIAQTLYGPMQGVDLFYVFGTLLAAGVVPSVVDIALSEQFQRALGAFIRTGEPVWDGLDWQTAEGDDTPHLDIGLIPSMQTVFRGGRCEALRALGVLP
jgi:para-nitrobenzyl esterase